MFALILVTGFHAFAFAAAAGAAGVAAGYAFRGKENKAIQAVGAVVGSEVGKISAEVKKV